MGQHKWALWDKTGLKVVKRCELLPTVDQSMPLGMDANLEWLLINKGVEPAYNQATEKLDASFTSDGINLNVSYAKAAI